MKVFVIGTGPQVEGQVTALAVRALVEHGHEVVLLEPSLSSIAEANRTYLEPLTAEAALKVIEAERPDAILAGIGRAATALTVQLKPSLPWRLKWLGPSVKHLGPAPAWPEADTVVEVAGRTALGQIEQLGDTWICPAPLYRPEADAQAVQALERLGFHGCARVFFKGGELLGVDTVVSAASAFSSGALGISIPRLAVRLGLGLPLDAAPRPGAVAVRRAVAGAEVMSLSRAAPPLAPGNSVVVLGAAGVEAAVRAEGHEPVVVDSSPAAPTAPGVARYFEPPSLEAVLAICKKEQPLGVLVQLGGRAALQLSAQLEAHGLTVLGTRGADVARALDREAFAAVVAGLKLQQPAHGTAHTLTQALALARRIGYPLLARVADELAYLADERALALKFQPGVQLEAFLCEAGQACAVLVRDRLGKVVVVAVVEHVEQAGVHAADAACTLPPHSLSSELVERLKDIAALLANQLQVVGLLEVHFALQGKAVSVLEATPGAGRTLPFVARATGLRLAELATRVMLGRSLDEVGLATEPALGHCAVREAVFDESVVLGPTRRSIGAVMAVAESLSVAFGKSQLAAGTALPSGGTVFVSVSDDDKPAVVDLARRLLGLGFSLACTEGTHAYLTRKGVQSKQVKKVSEGPPHVAELIRARGIAMVICTVSFRGYDDGQEIRAAARAVGAPNFTTVEAARMAVGALEAQAAGARPLAPLQAFARAG